MFQGGIAGLFALAQANAKRASEITVALEKIEKEVADEDASDAQLRSTYGTKWTLMPSAEASRDVKLDIQRYRELLQTAKLTDDTISAKLSSYQAGITQLSGVREALASKVPTANVAGIAEPEKARLRASLLELADIIQQRDALISALTEAGRVVCRLASVLVTTHVHECCDCTVCSQCCPVCCRAWGRHERRKRSPKPAGASRLHLQRLMTTYQDKTPCWIASKWKTPCSWQPERQMLRL